MVRFLNRRGRTCLRPLGVQLNIALPLFRHIVFVKDCVDGTLHYARFAVDAAGVIKYLGWGLSPHGGPFVMSEWIEGQALTSVQMTTPEIFCDYLRQICIALDKVHRAGIVHGDLTPNNILIDQSERATITDFGFSQRRRDAIQIAGSSAEELDLLLGGTVGFAAQRI